MRGLFVYSILLLSIATRAQLSQTIQFENCYEEIVTVKEKAVLIMIKDLYCTLCFDDLKKVLTGIPHGATVYLELDGLVLNSRRIINARQVVENRGLR
jgi:hypothetical protein